MDEWVMRMSEYKFRNLFKNEKTRSEKVRDWAWDHAPLLIWAVIGIFILLVLAYFQTVARADFLLQYGSAG